MALGKQIEIHRQARKWTYETLAERSGVDVGTLNALEKRDSTRSKYTQEIAKAFGYSIEQLMDPNFTGSTQNLTQSNKNDVSLLTGAANYKMAPVFSWNEIRERHKMEQNTHRETAPINTDRVSAATFWTRAETDAVSRTIKSGSLIAIDPNATLKEGDIALVDKSGQLLLRLIKRDGERWLLSSDSQDMIMQPETYNPHQDTLIGIVKTIMVDR